METNRIRREKTSNSLRRTMTVSKTASKTVSNRKTAEEFGGDFEVQRSKIRKEFRLFAFQSFYSAVVRRGFCQRSRVLTSSFQ